jgi:hypothetical protein
MPMAVKTSKVVGRRELRFDSLEAIVREAERVASCEADVLGNWSIGQILMHLARSVDASIDGFDSVESWYVRAAARTIKHRFLTRPMKAGLPAMGEVLVPGDTEALAGLKGLREAIARLAGTAERALHPAFGKLSPQEWDQLHMRHAELHLSFIVPRDAGQGRAGGEGETE